MKGIVFTEFLEMVEETHGYEMVDTIINKSDLESEGAYTVVGTYPHQEMVALISNLSKETQTPVSKLLYVFGTYLFNTFTSNYKAFFDASDNVFDFFESIENYIHVEVLKLYPDAELPSFRTESRTDNNLRMIYSSERKMADFALGLIESALQYYKVDGAVEMERMKEDGSKVLFIITKNNG